MTIRLKGIYTPPAPETRDMAYLEVDYNGETYDWTIYYPQGANIGEYLASAEESIYAQIAAKEAEWAALSPKTRIELDSITGQEIVVDINKNEIVKPEIPDYYAKRRNEYPPIGDQLGAIAKGFDSTEYLEILAKIDAVKAKYSKP